jgi:hypothetical protein
MSRVTGTALAWDMGCATAQIRQLSWPGAGPVVAFLVETDAALGRILGVSRQAVCGLAERGKIRRTYTAQGVNTGLWDVFGAVWWWRAHVRPFLRRRRDEGPPWLDPLTPLTRPMVAELILRARRDEATEWVWPEEAGDHEEVLHPDEAALIDIPGERPRWEDRIRPEGPVLLTMHVENGDLTAAEWLARCRAEGRETLALPDELRAVE